MPLLQVDLWETGALSGADEAARRAAEGRGPVIVMIHGYKFRPGDPRHCPHRHILALAPAGSGRRALSWPRALGFGRDDPAEGLGIAFGWPARGTIWCAYRRAELAGRRLAGLVATLRAAAPHRPVHLIGHSLGARVALQALPHLPEGAVTRAILLAAAEYAGRAETALAAPAGRAAELVNVTSRENDLFDFLLERLVAPGRAGDRMLGHGLAPRRNLLTLQLDDPRTLAALAARGYRVAPPSSRICHWSGYLRPGVFALYADLMRRPEMLTLPALRAALPAEPAPRWSRLLARSERLEGLLSPARAPS
ncbi:MAG: alpha/beta fold hydrolase [Paracoccaceae bacterium]